MTNWSSYELAVVKSQCEQSHLTFTRYFFKTRENYKMMVESFHRVIADTLDKVIAGKIKRLIINVPPGYTKTEMAVIAFIARGLAINPRSKYIHTSYSDSLVLLNSMKVKDTVMNCEYQKFWPIVFRKDSTAKKAWYTQHGGGLVAVSTAGSVTGFRAGQPEKGFSGAIIIDDPHKPDDIHSIVKRTKVNSLINSTVKSRLMHNDVPIIIIMQRLHEDDMTGYLLKGGTGEIWDHLLLPAEIPEISTYPTEYTHGRLIEHGLKPGIIWPYKHTSEQLTTMRKYAPYDTASQYDQKPAPMGGGIFKEKWFRYYKFPPFFDKRFITADTAMKTKQNNDYSVFMAWGVIGNELYLIDVCRGKWEAPELERTFIDFWNKHKCSTLPKGRCEGAYIEDKASGTGLIQKIRREYAIPVLPIQRSQDKVTRAMSIVNWQAQGSVYFPEEATWLHDFKNELLKFTPLLTHTYDDQVDAYIDGIEVGLVGVLKSVGSF